MHTHTRTQTHIRTHSSPQVRYVGVSNETSWGVCEFAWAAKTQGLPKIQTIQVGGGRGLGFNGFSVTGAVGVRPKRGAPPA
jgi:hypothetical protein